LRRSSRSRRRSKGGHPMPMGVTKKQERQYEHIKESYQERGVSADEAKERAARTVNKQKSKSKSKKKDS
jgi:plasmid stabilization system protein ParE